MTKKKPDDRDMFGTPKNRAKSWDAKKGKDPKKDRRQNKDELREEPQTFFGKHAKHLIENGTELEDDDDDEILDLGIYEDE
tara:strand:+ start:166 stop:408 length:243 start_codon:yes stop_codon:yes gene_type:complete